MQFSAFSITGFLVLFSSIAGGQRQPPGVPPQHYQQPQQMHHPPPPQYQQQHMSGPAPPPQHQYHQQQQVPVQPNQPQQQYGYQQQQQQVPVQHAAHHDHHGQGQQFLGKNIQHEKEHIAEHLEVPIDTSKMTEQELQFHYFKMHDSDNNNMLDGCELIKSLIHWHVQGSKDENRNAGNQPIEEKIFMDEELVSLIDPILQMDDTNGDGYIDYPEFIKAQQKAAAQQQPNSNRQQTGN